MFLKEQNPFLISMDYYAGDKKKMRALKPTLVSLQVMLMHPKRRIQIIVAVLVVLGLFSYVMIAPNAGAKNEVKKEYIIKEIFAPGPSKGCVYFMPCISFTPSD